MSFSQTWNRVSDFDRVGSRVSVSDLVFLTCTFIVALFLQSNTISTKQGWKIAFKKPFGLVFFEAIFQPWTADVVLALAGDGPLTETNSATTLDDWICPCQTSEDRPWCHGVCDATARADDNEKVTRLTTCFRLVKL